MSELTPGPSTPKLVKSSFRCAVKTCPNRNGKNWGKDVNFFLFPRGLRRKDWIHFVSVENNQLFSPLVGSRLCSKHFNLKYYAGGKLQQNAVPTLSIRIVWPPKPQVTNGSGIVTSNHLTHLYESVPHTLISGSDLAKLGLLPNLQISATDHVVRSSPMREDTDSGRDRHIKDSEPNGMLLSTSVNSPSGTEIKKEPVDFDLHPPCHEVVVETNTVSKPSALSIQSSILSVKENPQGDKMMEHDPLATIEAKSELSSTVSRVHKTTPVRSGMSQPASSLVEVTPLTQSSQREEVWSKSCACPTCGGPVKKRIHVRVNGEDIEVTEQIQTVHQSILDQTTSRVAYLDSFREDDFLSPTRAVQCYRILREQLQDCRRLLSQSQMTINNLSMKCSTLETSVSILEEKLQSRACFCGESTETSSSVCDSESYGDLVKDIEFEKDIEVGTNVGLTVDENLVKYEELDEVIAEDMEPDGELVKDKEFEKDIEVGTNVGLHIDENLIKDEELDEVIAEDMEPDGELVKVMVPVAERGLIALWPIRKEYHEYAVGDRLSEEPLGSASESYRKTSATQRQMNPPRARQKTGPGITKKSSLPPFPDDLKRSIENGLLYSSSKEIKRMNDFLINYILERNGHLYPTKKELYILQRQVVNRLKAMTVPNPASYFKIVRTKLIRSLKARRKPRKPGSKSTSNAVPSTDQAASLCNSRLEERLLEDKEEAMETENAGKEALNSSPVLEKYVNLIPLRVAIKVYPYLTQADSLIYDYTTRVPLVLEDAERNFEIAIPPLAKLFGMSVDLLSEGDKLRLIKKIGSLFTTEEPSWPCIQLSNVSSLGKRSTAQESNKSCPFLSKIPAGQAPAVVVITNDHCIVNTSLVYDQHVLTTLKNATAFQSVMLLLAGYHVFRIKYPMVYKDQLTVLQVLLHGELSKEVSDREPNGVEEFLVKLQQAKELLLTTNC